MNGDAYHQRMSRLDAAVNEPLLDAWRDRIAVLDSGELRTIRRLLETRADECRRKLEVIDLILEAEMAPPAWPFEIVTDPAMPPDKIGWVFP